MPKISIIIPLYENIRIDTVLDSLAKNSDIDHEVIVIDNSQSPEKIARIAAHMQRFPSVKYHRQPTNLGVTGGRNKGLDYLDPASEYILFLDHDVLLREDCLRNLLQDFEAIAAKNPIGILTGKVCYTEAHDTIWAAGTDINLYSGKIMFYCGRDVGQYETIRPVGVAPSIIFTRRALVEKLGGFNDLFFANYDDTEFCFRYRKQGYPTYYTPRAVGFHDIPIHATNNNRLLDRGYYIARNRILFMQRFSACYPIFLCFIPLWCAYYFRQYVKNNRTRDFKVYLKGTLDGLFGR